jgi:hypothetical protein
MAAHSEVIGVSAILDWRSLQKYPRLRFRIPALSSLRAIRLQDYSLCLCLRTLQAFALRIELFLRNELAQRGYESYVDSGRPECNGIRLNVKLTNG